MSVTLGGNVIATDVVNSENVQTVGTPTEYETVAASASGITLGVVGGTGDLLDTVTFIPTATGAGQVSVKDSSGGSVIILYQGGTIDAALHSWTIAGPGKSRAGAWIMTTGAGITVIARGKFKAT